MIFKRRNRPEERRSNIPLALGCIPNSSVPMKNLIFKKKNVSSLQNRIRAATEVKKKEENCKRKGILGLLEPVIKNVLKHLWL